MTGSPPHGRGKEVDALGLSCRYGITPAWAGKSSHPYYITLPRGDHPRVGGEKWSAVRVCRHGWGSPPRGRGKGCFPCLTVLHPGITPAWAGKSRRDS